MKETISKDWILKMSEIEKENGDKDIGAGAMACDPDFDDYQPNITDLRKIFEEVMRSP